MKSSYAFRSDLRRGAVMLVAAASLLPLTAHRAVAQGGQTILLFPATSGDKLADEVVTDAVKRYLTKTGNSVIVYNKRLSSIQRAVAENEKMFSEKDVEAGPGDDNRKTQRYADVVGTTEYVTLSVDGYKYDAASRTAKMNMSITRYTTATGAAVGTYAKNQQGVAPADVAKPLQEGSAAARAAEAGGEDGVRALYPAPPATITKQAPGPKRKTGNDKHILSIFGAALGVLYFTTR